MPASPDFDQIARAIVDPHDVHVLIQAVLCRDIREQLLFIWNARGAADLKALDPIRGRPEIQDVIRALRGLDR